MEINIRDKIFLYKLKPTYYALSEIILYCQKITNNIYLFKDYDLSLDFVVKNENLLEDILNDPTKYYPVSAPVYSKDTDVDLNEKIKKLVGNEFFSKIVFNKINIENKQLNAIKVQDDIDDNLIDEEIDDEIEEKEQIENELGDIDDNYNNEKKIQEQSNQDLVSLEGSESDFDEDNESEFSE